jgi:hypothetical protein
MQNLRASAIIILLLAQVGCTYSSVETAHSMPATVGESITWSIYTECGLKYSIFDLDGSLWVPVDVSPEEMERTPSGLARPDDAGTLTLISEDRAEYRSYTGRSFTLARHAGDLTLEGGCTSPNRSH